MKRLTLILAYILFLFSCPLTYGQENKGYVYDSDYIYDLNTYKVNEKTKTYSVNVFLDVTYGGDDDRFKSPYDNDNVTYLILETKYNPKYKDIKVKYRGFITVCHDFIYGRYIIKRAQVYYDTNEKRFGDISSDIDFFKFFSDNYVKDVTDTIYKAYKQNTLSKLEGYHPSIINEYIDE